jgi:hypothetical protein
MYSSGLNHTPDNHSIPGNDNNNHNSTNDNNIHMKDENPSIDTGLGAHSPLIPPTALTLSSPHLDSSSSALPSKKKPRRRINVEEEKGLEAFRDDLLRHLEENARITPTTHLLQQYQAAQQQNSEIRALADAALDPITDQLRAQWRAQWLSEYRKKIAHYNLKQLVKESVKFRFQCAAYVILVPSWHHLREVLWHHLKKLGIKKAKRSVSTKKQLIEICIQDSVKFDFSDCVKEVTSHGNKAKRQKNNSNKRGESNNNENSALNEEGNPIASHNLADSQLISDPNHVNLGENTNNSMFVLSIAHPEPGENESLDQSTPLKGLNMAPFDALSTAEGLMNYITVLNRQELTRFAGLWNGVLSNVSPELLELLQNAHPLPVNLPQHLHSAYSLNNAANLAQNHAENSSNNSNLHSTEAALLAAASLSNNHSEEEEISEDDSEVYDDYSSSDEPGEVLNQLISTPAQTPRTPLLASSGLDPGRSVVNSIMANSIHQSPRLNYSNPAASMLFASPTKL